MIVEIQKEYGFKYFEFMDEAVNPKFLNDFTSAVLENKLKIKYAVCVRTEKDFTKKTLKKMRKSGCVMLNWGYESHSKRILKLMNKGLHNIDREKILQDSAKAGIWNHVFFLFDFPTETHEEWLETKKIIFDSDDFIDSVSINSFKMFKQSFINKCKEKFNIEDTFEENDFSPYLINTNVNKKVEKQDRICNLWKDLYFKKKNELGNNLTDIHLFLYIAKYGREKVKSFKDKKMK